MRLDKQIAVVTGGGSGMGKACAEALLARGLQVAVWDTNITHAVGEAICCDVSSANDVEEAMKTTVARLGIPRIGINCAGVILSRRMVNKEGVMPLDDFQRVIDINLVGTFNVMRVLAAAMMDIPVLEDDSYERGVIINTASVAAFEGQIGQTAYSASKGGVVSMTLPAARELAQYGIRVNTIAPGLIETPMLMSLSLDVRDSLASMVPFPRRLGKPEEYAALAIHLIENSLINGEVVRLDGALRMQAK